ncbi:MAG: hypothetical protein M5R42_20495 [Rhodocyclaceae bacterium]|nr:hypothetical protein [Rhodocyclaceae bacterium]
MPLGYTEPSPQREGPAMGTNDLEGAVGFLAPIHARLRGAAVRDPHPDWRSRAALLDALERLLRENAQAIANAISARLRQPLAARNAVARALP